MAESDPLGPTECSSLAVAANKLALAIRDTNPVTPLHTLILSRRHAPTYFDLTPPEALAVDELLRSLRDNIVSADGTVTGFNIGINVGTAAGQTILCCHVHLIPRRRGDVPDPWGGDAPSFPGKHIIPVQGSAECVRRLAK